MLLQEVPNVTFKSIRMMSTLIYNAISQKYMKKGEKQSLLDYYQFQVLRKTVTSVTSHKIKTTYQIWKCHRLRKH